jgi:hypothetical protein
MLASCASTPLAELSPHVIVLATHALADIPLELLDVVEFGLVESMG